MPGHQAWSVEAAASLLRTLPPAERLILPALQRVQHAFGWIPDEAVDLIAAELNVSINTVRKYIKSIYRKLNINTSMELANLYLKRK